MLLYYILPLLPRPYHLFLDLSTVISASSDVVPSIVKVYKYSLPILYQYINNNNVYGRGIGISRPYTVAMYIQYKSLYYLYRYEYNIIIICIFYDRIIYNIHFDISRGSRRIVFWSFHAVVSHALYAFSP